jgi:hypothetical protein
MSSELITIFYTPHSRIEHPNLRYRAAEGEMIYMERLTNLFRFYVTNQEGKFIRGLLEIPISHAQIIYQREESV